MVFNEWSGELTDAQWRAYRGHKISPSDRDSWTDTGWDGDTIAAWVNTVGSLDCAPNCLNGLVWPRRGSNPGSPLLPPSTLLPGSPPRPAVDRPIVDDQTLTSIGVT